MEVLQGLQWLQDRGAITNEHRLDHKGSPYRLMAGISRPLSVTYPRFVLKFINVADSYKRNPNVLFGIP